MALPEQTITAIAAEKVRMLKDQNESSPDGLSSHREKTSVRISEAVNGFTVNAGFGSSEFIATTLEMAFEIAAEFFKSDSEKPLEIKKTPIKD